MNASNHQPGPRFHLPDLAGLSVGQRRTLESAEAHHALHVLRLREGVEVSVFDGRGRWAPAVVASAGRRNAELELSAEPVTVPPAEPALHLASAVPKGKRLDWLLEKATELGAASVTWVTFERSVGGQGEFSANARQRHLSHCISAGKQSGSLWLPELAGPIALDDWLNEVPEDHLRLVGAWGNASRTVREALGVGACPPAIHLLVGPEGGLTEAEQSAALTAGCLPVRLGQTILRIETAGVALLAAVRAMADGSPTGSAGP